MNDSPIVPQQMPSTPTPPSADNQPPAPSPQEQPPPSLPYGLPVPPTQGQQPFAPHMMSPPPSSLPAKPPRKYTIPERALVFVAFAIGLLYDRLLFANFWRSDFALPFFSGIFWLVFLVALYAFYWQRLKANKTLWIIAGLTAALCIWNLLFDYESEYGILTFFVIPAVMMAHCQFLAGDYKLKDVGKVAVAWLTGWFIKPFSAIPMLFGASRTMVSEGKNATTKKVLIGVAVALPLLMIILPLLSSADLVFSYYLGEIFYDFNFASFIGHVLLVAVGTLLFFSYLWNIGFADKRPQAAIKELPKIDNIISGIVLGAVLVVYVLFCTVQFTYLFAGAGLPGEMTYSEYAREGFAQIIAVCGLNLALFGVFLRYGKQQKVITALLAGLLFLTGVMLVSGFVRLGLYIGTYGLTWLRLLSTWFMIYLAVTLILCAVRMVKEQLPLIAVCAVLLLGWYAVLGFANPDALVVNYNLDHNENAEAWLEKNDYYLSGLSDDAMLALLDRDLRPETLEKITKQRQYDSQGHSLASVRLAERMPKKGTNP